MRLLFGLMLESAWGYKVQQHCSKGNVEIAFGFTKMRSPSSPDKLLHHPQTPKGTKPPKTMDAFSAWRVGRANVHEETAVLVSANEYTFSLEAGTGAVMKLGTSCAFCALLWTQACPKYKSLRAWRMHFGRKRKSWLAGRTQLGHERPIQKLQAPLRKHVLCLRISPSPATAGAHKGLHFLLGARSSSCSETVELSWQAPCSEVSFLLSTGRKC